jgi:hypothetical protein
MELSPWRKLSNTGPSRATRSLHGDVLTSSPVIQRKKLKAKRMKNNFKKMVRNRNSSNSTKNDDSGYCKECKEYYYVTKEERDWIKCSVCEKWSHEKGTTFSKTCTIVNVVTVVKNLKNVRNLQRSKESHSDTKHILFYFILLQFCLLQIY